MCVRRGFYGPSSFILYILYICIHTLAPLLKAARIISAKRKCTADKKNGSVIRIHINIYVYILYRYTQKNFKADIYIYHKFSNARRVSLFEYIYRSVYIYNNTHYPYILNLTISVCIIFCGKIHKPGKKRDMRANGEFLNFLAVQQGDYMGIPFLLLPTLTHAHRAHR